VDAAPHNGLRPDAVALGVLTQNALAVKSYGKLIESYAELHFTDTRHECAVPPLW